MTGSGAGYKNTQRKLFGSRQSMPYKFNDGRRRKIPKAKFQVTNWPDYDAALVRRGSLTVWATEEAVAAWHAPSIGKRGGSTSLFRSGDRDGANAVVLPQTLLRP